jgi:hypothetical protein
MEIRWKLVNKNSKIGQKIDKTESRLPNEIWLRPWTALKFRVDKLVLPFNFLWSIRGWHAFSVAGGLLKNRFDIFNCCKSEMFPDSFQEQFQLFMRDSRWGRTLTSGVSISDSISQNLPIWISLRMPTSPCAQWLEIKDQPLPATASCQHLEHFEKRAGPN